MSAPLNPKAPQMTAPPSRNTLALSCQMIAAHYGASPISDERKAEINLLKHFVAMQFGKSHEEISAHVERIRTALSFNVYGGQA